MLGSPWSSIPHLHGQVRSVLQHGYHLTGRIQSGAAGQVTRVRCQMDRAWQSNDSISPAQVVLGTVSAMPCPFYSWCPLLSVLSSGGGLKKWSGHQMHVCNTF